MLLYKLVVFLYSLLKVYSLMIVSPVGTVAFGSDEFKTTLAAGRYSEFDHDPTVNFANAKDVTAEYYGVQFDYTPNDSLALNAGLYCFNWY